MHLTVLVSHAQAHQLAAIEHLERLHQELLVWRPPPPPPPPPPPKESKWRTLTLALALAVARALTLTLTQALTLSLAHLRRASGAAR